MTSAKANLSVTELPLEIAHERINPHAFDGLIVKRGFSAKVRAKPGDRGNGQASRRSDAGSPVISMMHILSRNAIA